jgi:hypothetical protein
MKIELEITGVLEDGINYAAERDGEDPEKYMTERILDLAGNYAWQQAREYSDAIKKEEEDILRESITTAKEAVKAK